MAIGFFVSQDPKKVYQNARTGMELNAGCESDVSAQKITFSLAILRSEKKFYDQYNIPGTVLWLTNFLFMSSRMPKSKKANEGN